MQDEQRVITEALKVTQDQDRAIDWYRNTPIAEFNHQTAEQLIADHKIDALLKYLASIRSGWTG